MPSVEERATGARVIRLIDDAAFVVANVWSLVRDEAEASALLDKIGGFGPPMIVPAASYLAAAQTRPESVLGVGVWIAPDADFESYARALSAAPLIAIDFPSFRDGRGLSIGFVLRTRFGYRGELRAIGDVLRDQLENMRRCGFDSFAVRADKSITDALKGFSEISVRYQGMVADPRPLFRRREDVSATQTD
jgi:uncharacterized protein (DUF934 family)